MLNTSQSDFFVPATKFRVENFFIVKLGCRLYSAQHAGLVRHARMNSIQKRITMLPTSMALDLMAIPITLVQGSIERSFPARTQSA